MKPLKDRMEEANRLLSPSAVKHAASNRVHREEEDETRFPFQRDRDRIIHCQAFRRLKHKTQVFVAGSGDHYRTRLTHTMEVAQISRDMARTLGLNEDLVECIALAHDLGHPPFAHAGEEALDACMREHGLHFEHNEQSLRIVTLLETRCAAYPGLNLNREVLEGLKKHATTFDIPFPEVEPQPTGGEASPHSSLEAQLVNLADEIAYTAHDTDDGLRAGLLSLKNLRASELFNEAEKLAQSHGTEARGNLIHLLISDAYALAPAVRFSPSMMEKLEELRSVLLRDLYNSPAVRDPAMHGKEILRTLFSHYLKNPPEKVMDLQKRTGSALPIVVCDYISGMTDMYAIHVHSTCPAFVRPRRTTAGRHAPHSKRGFPRLFWNRGVHNADRANRAEA